jgi:phosphoribosylamine--glycine ligase
MKILVIGQGGREHALVKAFSRSPSVSEVHAIPGSDGMSREALCHDLDWRDFEAIVQFCIKNDVTYVFIGPEDPLVAGLSDFLRDRGILVVGPSQESARLEGSKIFSKQFMQEAQIPTSFFAEVHSVDEVMRLSGRFSPPYVFKADGLAAGKGVFICKDLEELKQAAIDVFEKQILGLAGSKALLEQFIPGWELSYLVVTNGSEYQTLPLSQDHKRLKDNDEGPNTGGMGTVAPLKISQELQNLVDEKILRPTFALMQKKNFLYRGVLYFGLMITDQGPQVLEFNCRFGDPETQVILPLLDQDVGLLFKEVSLGKVPNLKTKNMFASCVVMASQGYPLKSERAEIGGDIEHQTNSSYFIHAGTQFDRSQQEWFTKGGRVLCSIGLGSTLKESLQQAYWQSEKVSWTGLQKRSDIGSKLSR